MCVPRCCQREDLKGLAQVVFAQVAAPARELGRVCTCMNAWVHAHECIARIYGGARIYERREGKAHTHWGRIGDTGSQHRARHELQ
jgi:hypothetical protein